MLALRACFAVPCNCALVGLSRPERCEADPPSPIGRLPGRLASISVAYEQLLVSPRGDCPRRTSASSRGVLLDGAQGEQRRPLPLGDARQAGDVKALVAALGLQYP